VAALVIMSAPVKAQVGQDAQIILDLLNGQQYFGVPHVYMGCIFDNITTRRPPYY